ncbi:ATP-binding protein [Aliirhizobium terrae]|uniref:sensor histidine kinase n=1 Tax=Terrirhizobium terrae TaxID=2926709 RepID=UPI00257709D2|nr:ATP-binding protein [Rhizobium sp. CC-CFT758]WJH41492.1 ATP-binding protein [Rhizobium sp. CC-CFT758]
MDLIRFVDVNHATVKLLGCGSATELLGPITPFLPANSDALLPLVFAVEEGGHRFEREIRLRSADGREAIVLFVAALPDDREALDRVACAMIDVTEREQAKEALIAAQGELARAGRVATVGAISATIAHEVNQPIGAVVMFAQACIRWLKAETPDIQAAANAAEKVVQHSMRASQIIQRTREQIKGNQPKPELIDLADLVSDVLGLLERDITTSGTRVRTIVRIDSAVILANRIEMQQVIANLVTNGIHAMATTSPDRRELRLKIDSSDDGILRLKVRDTGIGIHPDNLVKLFNPFFTTKSEGMGVGLSICKTIVEAHGGSLSATNHTEGGAVFQILLPPASMNDIQV